MTDRSLQSIAVELHVNTGMKYVSLGLQVFTAYSMDNVDRRSGKFSVRKDKDDFFFLNVYFGKMLHQTKTHSDF